MADPPPQLSARERVSRYLVRSAARTDSQLPLSLRPVVVRAADLEEILRDCPEPCQDGSAFDADADQPPVQPAVRSFGGRA